jgi:hypothetical protein
MKKEVYRSLFYYGFAITKEFQPFIQAAGIAPLKRGEYRSIKLLIGDELCVATLTNQSKGTKNTNNNLTDTLQIRYGSNSRAAIFMRKLFTDSFSYLDTEYIAGHSRNLRLPNDRKEYFILNSTSMPDVFEVQSLKRAEIVEIEKDITGMSEIDFEHLLDETAGIKSSLSLKKIRRLDRSIGDSLKKLYDYRCQVTGEKIGELYGTPVIEAHHIDYFTKSLNNDASNIIILSPNFHRIIHQNNPRFNRNTLTFEFPNGYHQKLILDNHLSSSRINSETT